MTCVVTARWRSARLPRWGPATSRAGLRNAGAARIYEDLPALHGILYRGAHQGGESVAVFDRAGELHAKPGTPADGTALAGSLADRVMAALAAQARYPVWVPAAACGRCRAVGL